MSELYERIEGLCLQKGVNITQMCRESGVSRGSLSDLKMGRVKKLGAVPLSKIANYFDTTTEYLLSGQKEKPAAQMDDELAEYLEQLKNRPEMRMLFSLTKGATKEDVERAVRIIEAALGK